MVETIRRFDIELNSTQPQEATLVPEVGSEIYNCIEGSVVDMYAHNHFSADTQGQQMEFKHEFFIPPAEVERDYKIEVSWSILYLCVLMFTTL